MIYLSGSTTMEHHCEKHSDVQIVLSNVDYGQTVRPLAVHTDG